MRKTKIMVTIGPSCRDPKMLDQLISLGIDCARLNFSHGTLDEHAEVIDNIRRLSKKHNRPVAILQDLGGIKLRLGTLNEPVLLNPGDTISLVPEHETNEACCHFPSRGHSGTSRRAITSSSQTGRSG